jgi:hypothetical protein
MPTTNFDLAPPAKMVDGLLAVPIDIQQITAHLTFNGTTGAGTGDATLDFTMGPQNGNPIFDLRQTITAAWLDGAPLSVPQLAHHDFGGGPQAQLRVVQSVLAAGSTHTLRVTYTLGPPQASTAGSYQPAMTWSAGPRLAFNFGFTDLGAGRYLEAWIPANLIFDQYAMTLELSVLNTPVAHSVITNGTATSLGANHWSVAFPARFTALSPLLELRATDTVASMTDTTTLPVSGTSVTIEAWKLAASAVELPAQIANLKTWLANNETSTGPYLHGNRFVAFLHTGGMEYEGGTTTGTGALRHETFHSWWARGLKPASQADGWWDEAWTVYNDLGASSSLAFDFSDPPVELCSRNPWVRVTAGGAYTAGKRFFDGAAALIGVATLKSLMSDFYKAWRHRPATTPDLESFLVARSGQPQLVDAYHRFVYGFADPVPAPDLWLRDDPGHTGADAWAGTFWDSPDLWIRNADDGGTTHQSVEHGQDNWFYARVRNRSTTGTARHYLVTFNAKAFAGLEFVYPGDFLPGITAAAGFELRPGSSAIVKTRWPKALVPPVGTHVCWLAAVLTRSDHPVAGRHVWEHNNLAQKNLSVVNLVPDASFVLPFVLNRFRIKSRRPVLLELVRPKGLDKLEAALLHRSGIAFGFVRDRPERPALPLPVEPISPLDCGGVPADEGAEATMGTAGGTLTAEAGSADRTLIVTTGIPEAPGSAGVIGIPEGTGSPGVTGVPEATRSGGLTGTAGGTDALIARQFDAAMEVPFEPGPSTQIPIALRGLELVMGLRVRVPATAKAGDVLKMHLVQRDATGKRILGGLAIQIHVRRG